MHGEQDGREDIVLQNAVGNGKAVQEWGRPTDGQVQESLSWITFEKN